MSYVLITYFNNPRLDIYILDYLTKRKLNASKKVFGDEAKVPINIHAIDAPRGFLFEWWAVFWDIFISRYKHHQGFMEPCSEDFRLAQQQRRQQGSQHQSQNANNVVTGRNTWVAEASTSMRQAVPKDMNSMMSSLISQSAQGSEGLPTGAHAATGVLNNLPLKGWPLTGPDQILTRFYQQKGALHQPPLLYQGQIEGQNQPPSEREIRTANAIGGYSSSAEASLPHSPHNDKINIDEFLNYGALDGIDNSLLSRRVKKQALTPLMVSHFWKPEACMQLVSLVVTSHSMGNWLRLAGKTKRRVYGAQIPLKLKLHLKDIHKQ
ncbi:hypothetical protein L1987_31098 [Smallanthus sonchifolius]|uniref:Uncharacterized protein n=1 Tax=Smallanthus sonchifolius TaxID=185202 RepID=A0ACB9I5X4_9ASTR|nr:hypothetical protein L1987_31098 [Smallanthus sonchifolius]